MYAIVKGVEGSDSGSLLFPGSWGGGVVQRAAINCCQ